MGRTLDSSLLSRSTVTDAVYLYICNKLSAHVGCEISGPSKLIMICCTNKLSARYGSVQQSVTPAITSCD